MCKKVKNQKLTKKEVVEIKILLKKGLPVETLADTFGVTKKTIYDIKNFFTWRHINP